MVAVIHQTDLFHPPADPDDHWDLACVFALALRGSYNLLGIVIDYPHPWHSGDPAIAAVAQLGHLTGIAAPVVVGAAGSESGERLSAARFIVRTLQTSAEPVVIHVVGSCRDVALATELDRDVFAERCSAIYLNAGVSDPERVGSLQEYNVMVDPPSFRRLFDVPCQLNWLPAFDRLEGAHPDPIPRTELGWSSRWTFNQGDVLAHLAEPLRRYFDYALDADPSHRWLRALETQTPDRVRRRVDVDVRRMWCTAGFLHAAGFGVSATGDLVAASSSESVYGFESVEASCDEDGFVAWRAVPNTKRSILRLRDQAAYPTAMRTAMTALLAAVE